jgi:hypothetical protein
VLALDGCLRFSIQLVGVGPSPLLAAQPRAGASPNRDRAVTVPVRVIFLIDGSESMARTGVGRDLKIANSILSQADVQLEPFAPIRLEHVERDRVTSEDDIRRLLAMVDPGFRGLNVIYVRDIDMLGGEARGMAFRPFDLSAARGNAIFLSTNRLPGITAI